MLKSPHTPHKSHLYTLLTLLVAVVALMFFIYKSTHKAIRPPFSSGFVRAGADTINVAIEMNPAVYMVRGDSVSGRDYNILQEISRVSGRPVKFHPFVPLQRAIDALSHGDVDILVASLPLTTELRERFLMSDPVYLDREILVQSAADSVRSQLDLAADTVWITENSPFRSRLENMSHEIGDTIFIKSSPEFSAEALFLLTAKGVIRYAVINEGIARALAPKYPEVDISTPISFTQFQAWALDPSSTELCDSVNSWLKSIQH